MNVRCYKINDVTNNRTRSSGPSGPPINIRIFTMKKQIYKKSVRLKNFSYKGYYRYFITICTAGNKNVFNGIESIKWILEILKEKSVSFKFKILAYCFMPDHLHILIEGIHENSDMTGFIKSFKQNTSFHYKKKFNDYLWQPSFYEHILRTEEDTVKVVEYIFENPVRKNIVDNYKDYELLGSLEFDIANMLI